MSAGLPDDLAKRICVMLAAIDVGVVRPDPLKLLRAAGVLKDAGELSLALECERLARRKLPNPSRDLS